MLKMTSEEIRTKFLDFFKSKNHLIVPSAPMVNKNDPGLMFTNAGMNQFKDIFLANKPIENSRVADSQKCLRVSGKHNDLEEVGNDTYHHTMFEMLGNWSFGDYFKTEAIEYAWELLTDVFQIEKDRLYVTIFGGDKSEGLEQDVEAGKIWEKYVNKERIILGNKKDNFWEMGEQGPCGPCSEIHIDLRDDEERNKINGAELVNKDNPLVIEIWNLVFIQFNRKANGELEALQNKHIDTGMGFERLCMVLQNKKSNYDTDVFQPLIQHIAKAADAVYGKDHKKDVAMRVMVDHLRAISFAITDGQLPSNTGAGYVIRRILRRAVRYGYTFLNFKEPFLYSLVDILVEIMGKAYPELVKQQELCKNIISEEEASFLNTLQHGIDKFNNYIKQNKNTKTIDGDFVFELFDTFGFPVDLTELMASELGLNIDMKGFNDNLEAQKNRSRKAAEQTVSDWVYINSNAIDENTKLAPFCWWDKTENEVIISRYREVKLKNKIMYHLVFLNTPFYAEGGGQIGDIGTLENEYGKIKIVDTVKENDLIIHITPKILDKMDKPFIAKVDQARREAIMLNHSATHLLHLALRRVLGMHVEQKGSYVGPDYLRFDFSHYQKMSDEEILQVETMVNTLIRKNDPCHEERNMAIKDALEMGAMAFFGDKYGDTVRVVSFGDSIELCGGTHVPATGSIGVFKIVTEAATAAGIRRIEAVTGKEALKLFEEQEKQLNEIKHLLKAQDSLKGVKQIIEQNNELKKQIEQLNKDKQKNIKNHLLNKIEQVNGIELIAEVVDVDAKGLKDLAFELKQGRENMAVVLGTRLNNKAAICVVLTDDVVVKGYNAGQIIKEAVKEIQGGGGGQPHFATAGGKQAENIEKAVEKAKSMILIA